MIHKYEKEGIKIVLDIDSDSIHVVDDVAYDVLDFYPEADKEIINKELLSKYSENEINDAIIEIESLIEKKQLFAKTFTINQYNLYNNPVVKAICLHVAHDCNIRCKYCFASQGDFQRNRSLMSLEVGKKSLKYLAENSGNHYNLEVDFFGGEPLLNFDVVKELVFYGRSLEKEYKKHFRYTLTTNGTLLTPEITEFMNEHMDNVVLSIDGRKKVNDKFRIYGNGKGTYDQIVPKFKEVVDNRDKLYYVRGTFTKNNLDFSEDIFHLADLGFKSLSIEPVVTDPENDYALSIDDLDTINEQYDIVGKEYIKRQLANDKYKFDFFHFNLDLDNSPCFLKKVRGCGAGLEYIAVTPNGDIYPCHQFVEKDEFLMGNVFDGIKNKEIAQFFKKSNILTKKGCDTCWVKYYCSGGCHANAYNANGDIDKPYELGCEMERNRIENAIYIQAKLALERSDDKEIFRP
jgi:uncharacterized protein